MLEDRNCWLHVLMRLPLSWIDFFIFLVENTKYFNTHKRKEERERLVHEFEGKF